MEIFSQHMDNSKQGEELNQLSRLLFDNASDDWYKAIGLEIITALIGVVASVVILSNDWKLITAIIGLGIFMYSYYLKLRFENTFDRAETMRRQSVVTEALGWPIGKTQFSEWRRRAGMKVLNDFKLKQRDKDYYSTTKPQGSRRLLEMTIESAFFTRHLYCKLQQLVWGLLVITVVLSFGIFGYSQLQFISSDARFLIIYTLYLLLPIMLTIDLIGLGLRLGRLSTSIEVIEEDMEKLDKEKRLQETQVIRLVSEYNCQVSSGVPIHSFLFRRWHDDINELWKQRNK